MLKCWEEEEEVVVVVMPTAQMDIFIAQVVLQESPEKQTLLSLPLFQGKTMPLSLVLEEWAEQVV
ncbi:TPA: hypothetical protein NPR05_004621 [Salmonella enterica]|nr:hypothetical protein [Salmonella enterica]